MSLRLIRLIAVLSVTQTTAQTYLGNYSGYTVDGRTITVHADSSRVRFLFYLPEILRVDFLPTPSTNPDSSFVVIRDTSAAIPGVITETDSTLSIASSVLSVQCTKVPLRFSFFDGAGGLLLAEPPGGGLGTDGLARLTNYLLDPDVHFYGTGERGIGLDLRGHAFESYNTQVYGYNGALPTMNVNIPLLTSSHGYALLFDNTFGGYFDLGAASPTQFSYRAAGGELTFFLIAGETVPDQLEMYTWLSGRQPMPPRWSLGYLQSKYGYHDETEARAMVETMRAKQIPCDAIIIDGYWFNDMGDLSWNTASWPDPFGMMNDFRDMGFRTVLITQTYITSPSLTWGEVVAGGLLGFTAVGQPYILHNWWSCDCDAGLLDLTNPDARSWFWAKHPAFLGSEVAGLWTDLGEPERHPSDMLHVLGPTSKVHNIYNLLWAETVSDGFGALRPDERLFNLTRSGFAGIQRYGVATWSGDVAKTFGALAVQVPMLLNMGMSGIGYHNSDIGGFCCGVTTPELYIRWMQFGALGPLARAHGAGPAVGGQNTEPWAFGPVAEDICRDFLRLRYQLLPYIYTLARENHETGMPLVRPLFFHDPLDNTLADHGSSFLLGKSLLVSPVVTEGQANKDVHLPAGTWFSYWDDELYGGGTTVNVPTPLETIPLFVKAGSIIPRQPVMDYTDERPVDTLMLSVYPSLSEDASFILYEDDGVTLEYQSGAYALTGFLQSTVVQDSLSSVTIDIGPTQGTYSGMPLQRVVLADIHGIAGGPVTVRKNGVVLPERFSYNELRSGEDGFYYDGGEEILYVQALTVPSGSYQLVAEEVLLSGAGTSPYPPAEFVLEQNYPNPFNGSTTFAFSMRSSGNASLKIYDLLGREVATVFSERFSPGFHERRWDATGIPSGVYYYRMEAGEHSRTRKLVLVR
jgi:alpha-glucosidase (family GH31 glycosyl hydrolase)